MLLFAGMGIMLGVIVLIKADTCKDYVILLAGIAIVVGMVFFAAYNHVEAQPKIAYANCIIEHRNVDKCDVLNKWEDSEALHDYDVACPYLFGRRC